jgi:hypothetical protein
VQRGRRTPHDKQAGRRTKAAGNGVRAFTVNTRNIQRPLAELANGLAFSLYRAVFLEMTPTRTLRKNFFCDAQCYFFRSGLALRRWPRSHFHCVIIGNFIAEMDLFSCQTVEERLSDGKTLKPSLTLLGKAG